jgi:AraC-like DNA-binding protein
VEEPSFAAAHVLNLIEVVRRRGVSADALLAGIDLPPRVLVDPHVRVPAGAMALLFGQARRLTGEPALGLEIGLSVRPTLYGNLGFALMSATNLREAIELTVRFGPLVTTALRVRFRVEGPRASLTLDELADFGSARDVVVLAALFATQQMGVALTGRPLTTGVVELALPEPAYAAALIKAGVPVRFGCPVHQLVFDAASLDLPSAMHDPMALRLALDHCQRDFDRLGPHVRWSETVRWHLARQAGYPSLGKVASQLRQSSRTLKRRLAAEGVSFSALRDLELRERAVALVRTSDLSYAEIADRLGYKEVGSFHRAFRKWTATTPGVCRRAAGAPQP